MATKKDLVEAYSFSRRRLVTAFVSGAPGGREVEPSRPGRSIVGGLALGVLLIAGAAIAGVFTSNVDPAWADQPGLVISKEEAEVFVITAPTEDTGEEPVLHPILNITSAKLILGSEVEPQVIPESYIAEEEIGSDLGIFGAPNDVPDATRLIQSGWTACTDNADGGLRLNVAESPSVSETPAGAGMVVTVGKETWLVATSRPDVGNAGAVSAHRYLVPRAGSSEQRVVLTALGLDPAANAPVEVSREWINLLPRGGDISTDELGARPRSARGGAPQTGDVLNVNGVPQLTLPGGSLAPLDPFAFAVASGALDGQPVPDYDGDVADLDLDGEPAYLDARWPAATLEPVFGERCLQLVAEDDRPPLVSIVAAPEGEAAATGAEGEAASVDAGRGAFVLSGGWGQTEGGSPFVVDAKGYAYPIVGPLAPGKLGYDAATAPVVPDSWIELFDAGVQLSESAALCEPQLKAKPCA